MPAVDNWDRGSYPQYIMKALDRVDLLDQRNRHIRCYSGDATVNRTIINHNADVIECRRMLEFICQQAYEQAAELVDGKPKNAMAAIKIFIKKKFDIVLLAQMRSHLLGSFDPTVKAYFAYANANPLP